jgi:AraC-like DNA-binding protein
VDTLEDVTDAVASSYREWAPPAALRPWVLRLWRQDVARGAPDHPQLVLPDGCVDILVRPRRHLAIAGPATSAVTVDVGSGTTTFGVRFRPGAAGAALGLPAADLLDTDAPLDATGITWLQVEEPVLPALTARLRSAVPDALVLEAARRLGAGGTAVHELAGDLGVGERQLRRRFHAAVGYAPKTLDRVLRFQRFLRLAEGPDGHGADLAVLAAMTGYADQAHLARDCRRLSGLSPSDLLVRRGAA